MRWLLVALVMTATLATPYVAADAAGTTPVNWTATIAPVGRSGVTGSAGMTIAGQRTTLLLTVYRLKPGSVHAVAIRAGRCASTATATTPFALNNIRADNAGFAQATRTYQGHIAPMPQGWHIDIYAGTIISGRARPRVIACGLLAAAATTPLITRVDGTLRALIHPVGGGKVSGSAGIVVSSRTHTTVLFLTVSSLGPGAAHAVALLTGRCGSIVAAPTPFSIGVVQANSVGYVHVSDTYQHALILTRGQQLHINVYADAVATGASRVVACGDVTSLTMPHS